MARYIDKNSITGSIGGQIGELLQDMFPRENLLETFVGEKLGRSTANSIAWGSGLTSAAYDLVQHVQCNGHVGTLLEALQAMQPDNQKVKELTKYLVEAGYLQDTEAAQPARTYRKQHEMIFDRFTMSSALRSQLVAALRQSIDTNAALESLLIGSFSHDHVRGIAHGIKRADSIENNLLQVVSAFEQVRWLTMLVAAAQNAYQDNVALFFALQQLDQANRQLAQQPAPAPTKRSPAPAREPEPVAVSAVLKKLGKKEQDQLSTLLLEAFGSTGDLEQLARFDLGENLNNISGPGNLTVVAGNVVQWAIDQQMVTDLLNGMLKRRPRRSDIPEFARKLAQDGYVTLA